MKRGMRSVEFIAEVVASHEGPVARINCERAEGADAVAATLFARWNRTSGEVSNGVASGNGRMLNGSRRVTR